jgi:hypothetical protein
LDENCMGRLSDKGERMSMDSHRRKNFIRAQDAGSRTCASVEIFQILIVKLKQSDDDHPDLIEARPARAVSETDNASLVYFDAGHFFDLSDGHCSYSRSKRRRAANFIRESCFRQRDKWSEEFSPSYSRSRRGLLSFSAGSLRTRARFAFYRWARSGLFERVGVERMGYLGLADVVSAPSFTVLPAETRRPDIGITRLVGMRWPA